MTRTLFRMLAASAFIMTALTRPAFAEDAQAQALLDALQKTSRAPGLSAAVSKEGVIIWTGQSGLADVERDTPVTQFTRFRLASVSKLFTAALALRLSEEGLLELDEGIRTYVPDWPDHDGAVITLRHLATHLSGIAHYGAGDRRVSSVDDTSLNASLEIYAHKPLLFSPGEAYSYSSYAYALIGAAIENVTGATFEDNLAQYILNPVSLQHTNVEIFHDLPADASLLYGQHGRAITRNDQRRVLGATGMLSTPSDLVHFADAYMRGDIVTIDSVDMSLSPAILNNGEAADAGRFAPGFGWRVGKNWEGKPVFHHAGATLGARSILTVNRTRNLSAALLSNAAWTSRIETTGEMIAAAASENPDPKNCPVGEWRYEGVYASNPDAYPADNNARGEIGFTLSDGVCQMLITPQGELAAWLGGLPGAPTEMNAVLVAQRPVGLIFAVATPWGAFPVRFSDTDTPSLTGDFAGRPIDLSLLE